MSESGALDFRTAFLGACALIALLGGSLFGLWNSGIQQELDAIRTVNTAQWERLRALNDAVMVHTGRLDRTEKDTEDQERRLRDLERARGMR